MSGIHFSFLIENHYFVHLNSIMSLNEVMIEKRELKWWIWTFLLCTASHGADQETGRKLKNIFCSLESENNWSIRARSDLWAPTEDPSFFVHWVLSRVFTDWGFILRPWSWSVRADIHAKWCLQSRLS